MSRKIKFGDQVLNLIGNELKVGDKVTFNATSDTFENVNIENLDKITIFSVFPSISTSVCDIQTREISKLAEEFRGFDFIALSVDLPTTLAEWCASKDVKNIKIMSDYKNREFGKKYGFLIDELFLLDRGTFVLDTSNKVLYIEQLEQVKNQINFDKLKDFLQTL